ncbi:MAG: diphosphomevalonate/mevalonate 3,5-bisphosphate decarboxylase family protein, partial [Owenweeksia sp.]
MSINSKWRSPSNIALVKYWGKYHPQIPANPSISFTLDQCFTETSLSLLGRKSESEEYDLEVLLDGETQASFKPKITKFLSGIAEEIPFVKDYHLRIETHNSFPHSSGIASSASGMSALALCLLSIKEELMSKTGDDFYRKASEWSRLGSGSASRSVYGGLVEWGQFAGIPESNDEYAIPYRDRVHPIFQDFCDYVLLVETGSKKVSSTAGHGLMEKHPYAERRFLQAHENLSEL